MSFAMLIQTAPTNGLILKITLFLLVFVIIWSATLKFPRIGEANLNGIVIIGRQLITDVLKEVVDLYNHQLLLVLAYLNGMLLLPTMVEIKLLLLMDAAIQLLGGMSDLFLLNSIGMFGLFFHALP